MILRALLLAGLCCGAALGQFYSLAVSDDASQVYFRTDLRLKTEAPSRVGGAIYRLADGALDRLTPSTELLSYEADANPQVSGDGSVFSYTHYLYCTGGSSCLSRPTISTSYLMIGGKPYDPPLQGEAQISRNGRHVLSALVFGMTFPHLDNVVVLRDLQTGSAVDLPVRPSSSRQALTGDGRVLAFSATGGLMLWNPQSLPPALPVRDSATSAIINDSATWIIYTRGYGTGETRALELATGRDVALTGGDDPGFSPSISNDGALVLYQSASRQAWLVRPDGSGRRQLTDFADGVDEAVLAGNGRVAVAATGGRLVAIDTATGSVRELIGRTPICRAAFTALTPGSILPIRGSGMAPVAEAAPAPLPERLGGIAVTMNGKPLPLLSVSPTEIWFQVPFELTPGEPATVEVEHSSIFNGCSGIATQVVERAPYFFGGGGLTAAHEDSSSLVTAQSPARPREIVTVWAVGLGAVTPAMQTGLPTPLAPLHRLANPFECHQGYQSQGSPLEVVFAGLAPTMIGVYQVSVRMPATAPPDGWLFLNCGTPGHETQRHGGGIAVRDALVSNSPGHPGRNAPGAVTHVRARRARR